MKPNGATYYGLLATLRQSELLAEANRRSTQPTRHRQRGNLLGLIIPGLRRR